MLTGWLADRLGHQRLFIGAGVVGLPAIILLGQATTLWQVVILTAITWFCGGVGLTLVSVFTALQAEGNSRGKSFGLTWLAFPLATVIGGLTVGQLVTWQGYPLMFAALGVVWAGWPVVGLLGLEYKPISAPAPSAEVTDGVPLQFGGTFYLVLWGVLLSATATYLSRLGMSLSMQALNFSAGAVASTATVGGLITIPVTLLIGTLSDRLGRKGFLIVGYVLAAGGALTLSAATQLWHFWLASALLFVAMSVNGSVVPALATDLLAPTALSRGLAWLNAMSRVGGMVGFASAGYLMDTLGATPLYLIAAASSVMAATLLGLVPGQRQSVGGWHRWSRDSLIPLKNKAL
jgi:MFS family permease